MIAPDGPNAALPAAAKAAALARALVAFDPQDAEEAFELEIATLEYQRDHGAAGLVDAWTCAERADGRRWYAYVSRDGSGHSQADPPGQPIAATFRAEGRQPIRTALLANIERLESGRLQPGLDFTREDLTQLRNAVAAVVPENRAATLHFLATLGPDAQPVISTLDRMRAGFHADGYLVGEVLATIMIRTTLDPDRPAGTAIKERLDTVAKIVVDAGGDNAVQDVADSLRGTFAETLRTAEQSPDLETFMRALYRSVPFGYAAATLFGVLSSVAKDPDRRDRAARIHRQVQEDNARVRHAFVHQVTDLSGLQWHLERTSILGIRSADGDSAAQDAARRLIRLRLYPPALIPALTAAGP